MLSTHNKTKRSLLSAANIDLVSCGWEVSILPVEWLRMIRIYQIKRLLPTTTFALLFFVFVANPGAQAHLVEKTDTTIIPLPDVHIQLECTHALHDLYNF